MSNACIVCLINENEYGPFGPPSLHFPLPPFLPSFLPSLFFSSINTVDIKICKELK